MAQEEGVKKTHAPIAGPFSHVAVASTCVRDIGPQAFSIPALIPALTSEMARRHRQ